ncbi:MAG TPA: hypothetical protein VIV11_20700 [Kofleriaceae bacterium]
MLHAKHARSDELLALLGRRNGFYAFAGALHVFPAGGAVMDVDRWNDPSLWRGGYEHLIPAHCLCFAEDAFGHPFMLTADGVERCDPETAERELVASSIEDWAQRLVDEHRVMTGWPLAQAWQEQYGVLQPGVRLVPKLPFVVGGGFTVDNLYAANAVEAMRFRADLAWQISQLPDGTELTFEITP